MTGATVADVMASPAATIAPEAGLKEAAARLLAAASGLLAVVDGEGRVIGILSEADLLVKAERPPPAAGARTYAARVERQKWFGTAAGHLMSRPVVAVRPDAGLADAARLMRRHGLRCLAVVDDGGRPMGTVSRGDLLRGFLRAAGEEGLRDAALAVEDGVVTLNGEDKEVRR